MPFKKPSTVSVRFLAICFIHVCVRVRSATSEVDASRLEFHHKEQVERDQPAFGPDFNGREIDGG